ncbi:E3 ubiquitin-protein ligase ipaH9.8 [Pseudomonas reidholzensis]|uniref:RING-type E3 ubiquitin transferase n=1 Tax=Pseudomonas reidholzensis TaxID=1785162 RepID=A0A383RPX0_9PSED|nr:NEL-type E3 ubiquitin ligase domain-containing protein [Pseudomonas reidholzensis]SYX88935.1 E3 ubiquitin-protein ligase ipaH9.8 [Pseudomonas reidholzensis]
MTTAVTTGTPPDSIDALIARRLPDWLTAASLDRLRALHLALRKQQEDAERVRQLLAPIPAPQDFASEQLQHALLRDYRLTFDVRKARLRRVDQVILSLPVPHTPSPNITRVSTQSLLATALHNLTLDETRPGYFTQWSVEDAAGDTQALSFEEFAALCRNLDIGGRYQAGLRAQLLPADSQQRREIERLMEQALRSELESAVRLAQLRGEIDERSYLQMLRVISLKPIVPADTSVLTYRQLYLLGKRIHGVVVIETREPGEAYLQGLIVWIPGDPQQPLQEYPSWWAFYQALGLRLRDPHYARFFERFIAERDRAAFFAAWRQLHADTAPGAALTLDGRDRTLGGPLFAYLRGLRIDKMLDDARVLAVPTGDEDAKTRRARLEGYQSAGLTLLNLAGLFVPVLGEVMLAVAAGQLANEVYEGYEDWQLGDRHAALGHLFGVAESLLLGAAVGGAAAGAGHVLERLAFVDELTPMVTEAGQLKLCSADLAAYRVAHQDAAIGERVQHQGLWQLRLHEGSFVLAGYKEGDNLHISHPRRGEAYQPMLEHNGQGGWRHALERPQEWQGRALLLRRLGSGLADLTEEQVQIVLDCTGFDALRLRRLHLENAPAPARLLDAVDRCRLHGQFADLRGEAFEALLAASQPAEEVADALLRRDFPGLSVRAAQALVEHVDSRQVERMLASQRVPLALAERARWHLRDSRLDRACAGLRQAPAANADTERLALGLVDHVAPWAESLRIELRADSPQGPLQMQIGAPAADEVVRIVRGTAGYTVHTASGQLLAGATAHDSLVRALLLSLRDGQKQLLGDAELSEQQLSDVLASQARDDRELAARLIGQAPIAGGVRPPVRLGDGRLGYPLSGRGESHGQASRRGIGQIFPTLDAAQLQQYLLDLINRRVDPWAHYLELDGQLRSLRRVLRNWRVEQAGVLDLIRRGRVATAIRRCWRRKTGLLDDGSHALEIRGEAVGSLPRIPDDLSFGHVTQLTLRDMDLSEIDAHFLARFPQLTELDLRDNRLMALPEGLERLTALRVLRLDNNQIILTAADNRRLRALVSLQRLELNDNPLRAAPDVSRLIHLRSVGLRATGLERLPARVQQLPWRGIADLRDNQIRQVNRDIEGLRLRLNRVSLHDNPLDAASQRYLDDHPRQSSATGHPLQGTSSYRHAALQEAERSHWLAGSQGAQRVERETQWRNLSFEPNVNVFFRFLRDLAHSPDFIARPLYYRERVWSIIEACEQNTELRAQLFELLGGTASCEDRLLWLFSQMELRVLIHRQTASVSQVHSEVVLMGLGRSLFRLDRLDQIAARRIQAIRAAHRDVDDIEVYLAFRVRLAGQLRLPAQPVNLHFEAFSGLTPADYNNARIEVLRAESNDSLAQALAAQEFWQEHLRVSYNRRFTALVDVQRAALERYEAQVEAGEITEQAYLQGCAELASQLHEQERALIRSLTDEAYTRWPV